ncbi:MAG: alpha/beta fold hydrolase [Alphaproteobacteria bacterium]
MTTATPQEASEQGRPAWLPERLFPFESRFLAIDGGRLHYIDEGAGPVLLLLHGNPTWSFLYRDIVRGLCRSFRCVAPDYPGFGLSRPPGGYRFTPAEHAAVVERLVVELDLKGAILMVQDWGGPIGLGVAGRHPARFRGLVIGNTWAWPVNGDPHFEWFSRLMGGPLGRFAILNFNAFVNVLLPAGVRRTKLAPEVMAAYRGPFPDRGSRRPTHVFPREIIQSRAFLEEVEEGLPRLRHLPALILWGDRDFAFQEKERRRFETLFPDHRTHILRGAGHFIQEDAADEICAEIGAWWKDRFGAG